MSGLDGDSLGLLSEQQLPYLTADLPGIGGIIRARLSDFVVEELPLYNACGEGTHVYMYIEKRGISTVEAIARMAKALGRRRIDIGFAGMKDAKSIARQWFSLEHVETEALLSLRIPGVEILQLARHTNKIKLGHLRANRFRIRIRQMTVPVPEAVRRAEQILDVLRQKGAPNYFGPQRFGNRSDGHLLGMALLAGDADRFLDGYLGMPLPEENPTIRRARQAYDQGDYQQAYQAWPSCYTQQRRALKALISGADKRRACRVVDLHTKKLLVSAYQSAIFNRVLVARMPMIDQVLVGDMAYKHDNGACFRVEDPQAEQPRCQAWEISPTGPILGPRMTELTGPAGQIENPLLEQARALTGGIQHINKILAKGERRPLRFRPENLAVCGGADDLGPYVELTFELPSGSYATVLIREITKSPVA